MALSVCAGFAVTPGNAAAQFAEQLSDVKKVAVDWQEGGRGSAAVRERVAEKLKSSGKIEIVQNAAQADAVLRGSATIWATGYISTSPRSKGAEEAVYQGYASAELSGKNGKTLWSYLVTPRKPGWKSISDDLGDQLAASLMEAVGKKGSGAAAASSSASAVGLANAVTLHGAGATFPAPIYQKWFESFEQARPGIRVSYDAVGSEEGIRRIGQAKWTSAPRTCRFPQSSCRKRGSCCSLRRCWERLFRSTT
ncbi:MAG: substrate-binding domain-containing protein [Candidatus Acidiferrum sp.]